MIVVGQVEKKGAQEAGEKEQIRRKETHSIILSKRKEVRSTAAPGITPVLYYYPYHGYN